MLLVLRLYLYCYIMCNVLYVLYIMIRIHINGNNFNRDIINIRVFMSYGWVMFIGTCYYN